VKNSIIYITILVSAIISPVFADETALTSSPQKFIVTAYYSPLPNQSFYLKGSYEADIRLNGNGTHGASGKAVYEGMLAGPKTYAFGTKVYLEGLGIGTVDDRGGAIVSAGSRGYDADRLDIWMGQGEEGLRRALSWGKRSVMGNIIPKEEVPADASLDISKVKIVKISTKLQNISSKVSVPEKKEPDIFNTSVGKYTNPEKIKELQTILSQLSYYIGDIDGKYSRSLIDAIYDFQIKNEIISSRENLGAGYYGVKTRAKLQEVYTLSIENEKKRMIEEARLIAIKVEQEKKIAAQKQEVTLFVQNLGTPEMNDIGEHVRKLQQSLKSLGYFTQKDTAIFGKQTHAALVAYQTDKDISEEEFGHLGKATKEALQKDLFALKNKANNGLAWNGK